MSESYYIIARNPWDLAGSKEVILASEGMTLAEINIGCDAPYIIIGDGEGVLRAEWHRRVDEFTTVSVIILPEGGDGGSNPLRAVMMLAVVALSGPVGAWAGGVFAGATAASVMGAAASAATMLVGSMVVSAVLPAQTATSAQQNASLAAPSPTYSLSAQGNSARLGAVIPVQYGRVKAYPDFAAIPYAEYSGNNQYLYQLFCLGCGQYSIESILIDDAPISSYSEITYEVIQPHGQCTLFPANVVTASQVAGQTLNNGEFVGPFPASGTGQHCNRIGIDFIMPKGMFYANDSGGLDAVTVSVRVEYAHINEYGVETGGYSTLGSESWTMATNTPQRFTKFYSVAPGRYSIRVTRTNAENTDSRYGHTVSWGGLRGYLPETKDFGNVTLIAMRMLATDNLSQQSSRKVSVLSTRKVPVFNVTTWSPPTASRSIAWALADMLRETEYGCGVSELRLPLAELLALDAVWATRGDHFDGRFDNGISAYEALSKVATAGRAKFFIQGGFCRVARDGNASVPVAMFSERNIKKGSFSIDYLLPTEETADVIEMKYFDDQVWEYRTVKSDYGAATSAKVAKQEVFGVVDRAHAYHDAMFLAATNHLRRRIIKFDTEMDGFIPSPLDLIAIQHSMPGWSQQCEAVAWDDEHNILTVNEELEWGEGQHFVGIRKTDGGMAGPFSVSRGLRDDLIVFQSPPTYTPVVSDDEQVRSHLIFGESPNTIQYAKVIDIKPSGLYGVSIEAVNEDPSVHTADQGVVTPPVVSSDLVRDTGLPAISDLQVVVGGTIAGPEVSLSWQPSPRATSYVVDQSSDGNYWTRIVSTVTASARTLVTPGLVYLRVAGVRGVGIGPYLEWTGNLVDYMPPPSPPTGLALETPFVGRSCKFSWVAAARSDSSRVEIWAEGSKQRTIDVTGTRYQYSEEDATADGGPWRTITIRIYGVGNGVSAEYAELLASNPQVAALEGVAFIPGYKQIIASYNLPADTDFSGVILAMSLTDGFTPAAGDYAYDGPEKLFVVQTSPSGAEFINGQVWYLRIAGYDKFGKDSLQWSSQHTITIVDADANLTPEEILERLNSSFVQGNVIINGAGSIIAYNGASSIPNRDFVLMDAGRLTYQRYRDGQYVEYMGLKRSIGGVAASGATVVIPGYWDSQPSVTVGPTGIRSYEATLSGQSQAWAVRADNLRETSPGSKRWQFDAVAELNYASSSGTTVINQTFSGASNDQYSAEYNLPTNINSLTVNVSELSVRGTGTATYGYAYRQVTVIVQLWNGSGWVDSGSKVVAIGATTTGAKSNYVTCTGATGKTKVRIRCVAADAGGEFSLGANQFYQQGPYYTYGVGLPYAFWAQTPQPYPAVSYGSCPMGAFSMPPYSYLSSMQVTYSATGYIIMPVNGAHYVRFPDGHVISSGINQNGDKQFTQSGAVYGGGASYISSLPLEVCGFVYGSSGTASIVVTAAQATIFIQTAYLSNTTPANTHTLASLQWTTAGATTIATGSLSWQATGE